MIDCTDTNSFIYQFRKDPLSTAVSSSNNTCCAYPNTFKWTGSINIICVHYPRLCYQLSSMIGALYPRVVFGYKGILLIFGIFLAYKTQSVRLKQVNDSRFVGISTYNAVVRNQRNFYSFDFYLYLR